MIRKKASERNGEFPRLDISSLSDVSFLLLIYFLVTSTLDPREADLAATMPGHPERSPIVEPTIDYPRITVDAAGNVSMETELLETNPDSRTLARLDDRLRTWAEAWAITSKDSPTVELDVSDSVSAQRFIDVMNCFAGVGINQIIFVDEDD